MNFFKFLALSALITGTFMASSSLAIVGGQMITNPSALPTIPLVVMKHANSRRANFTICTSTIIAQNTVITTASCLSSPKGAMVVLGTEIDGHSFSKLAKIQVKRTRVLSVKAEPGVPYHQLTIAELVSSLPAVYHPIEMIRTNQFDTPPSEVLLAGFGSTTPAEDTGEVKQLHSVLISNPFLNAQSMTITALSIESPNKGASYGDAGGPAIIRIGDQDFLFGIDVAKGDDKHGMRSLILGIYPFAEQIRAAMGEFQK